MKIVTKLVPGTSTCITSRKLDIDSGLMKGRLVSEAVNVNPPLAYSRYRYPTVPYQVLGTRERSSFIYYYEYCTLALGLQGGGRTRTNRLIEIRN